MESFKKETNMLKELFEALSEAQTNRELTNISDYRLSYAEKPYLDISIYRHNDNTHTRYVCRIDIEYSLFVLRDLRDPSVAIARVSTKKEAIGFLFYIIRKISTTPEITPNELINYIHNDPIPKYTISSQVELVSKFLSNDDDPEVLEKIEYILVMSDRPLAPNVKLYDVFAEKDYLGKVLFKELNSWADYILEKLSSTQGIQRAGEFEEEVLALLKMYSKVTTGLNPDLSDKIKTISCLLEGPANKEKH